MASQNGRNPAISITKGICILTVINTHLLSGVTIIELVLKYIMQAVLLYFFWISGYLTKQKDEPLRDQYAKRTVRLITPLITFFVVLYIPSAGYLLSKGINTVPELLRSGASELLGKNFMDFFFPGLYLKTGLHEVFLTFWFIRQFLLSTWIFLPFVPRVSRGTKEMLSVCLPLVAIGMALTAVWPDMPLEIHCSPILAALMLFGVYCRSADLFEKIPPLGSSIKDVVIFAAVLAVMAIVNSNSPYMTELSYGVFGKYGVWSILPALLSTLCLVYFLVTISKRLAGWKLFKPLVYIGDYTDIFMYFHMFFAVLFCGLTGCAYAREYTGSLPMNVLPQCLLSLVVSLVCCYLLNEVIICLKSRQIKVADKNASVAQNHSGKE